MWTLKGKGLKAMHLQKTKTITPRRIVGDFSPSFFFPKSLSCYIVFTIKASRKRSSDKGE